MRWSVVVIHLVSIASRRPSLSSIRSQSSLRSYSSLRSQSSFRNYRPTINVRDSFRRTTSSPLDSMQQIMSNSSFIGQPIAQNHCAQGLRNKRVRILFVISHTINKIVIIVGPLLHSSLIRNQSICASQLTHNILVNKLP